MSKQKLLLGILFNFFICFAANSQQTIVKYLSGTDKDHTIAWDFYCTKGNNSGKWKKIPVPSCWELQGFGTYNYGGEKTPGDEVGLYRYQFKAEKNWLNSLVNIVFDGSMTDTKVKVNGKLAGKIHQGAFYQFKYDITPLLKFGKSNLLEVEVSKRSSNASINKAERDGDFWIFGGIFRPVYLEILPSNHIERVAIDAKANGDFNMQVFTANAQNGYSIETEIEKSVGTEKLKSVSVPVLANDSMTLIHQHYENVSLWNPEFPNLYTATISLKNKSGKIIHSVQQKFGFRTAELRPHDGFYLNGKKVMFKGVDHHSFWPESGRTTSKAVNLEDIKLIKEMNMNAVRMSHYPPDIDFLDACDSLGVMVLDELTGWQHFYDDTTGHKLVKELVVRDVNHPSILIWDNGNEGGFNRNLDNDYHLYDPQKRLVIHPWEKFNNTDTKHYPDYNYLINVGMYGKEVFFPTELLHGLYDGGLGAGLDDYWNVMMKMPHSAGGFLWVFADEGIVRRDWNDSIDTHKNNAPDGILGPHREKEGSFYTIKEIWSPVFIDQQYIPKEFDGKILVENRYLFTNLNQCSFSWRLTTFGNPSAGNMTVSVSDSGKINTISLLPDEKGFIDLALPSAWATHDVLYLTATDPYGQEIFTWSWPLHSPVEAAEKWLKTASGNAAEIKTNDDGQTLMVSNGNVQFYFNKSNGYLEKVMRNDSVLSLSGGPILAGFDLKLDSFHFKKENDQLAVYAHYHDGKNWLGAEWTFVPGQATKLSYSFSQRGEADFMGITFNYPEQHIKGMQWLGRGPYHVWKNRLKGLQFGLWDKKYNNTVTGESWNYPEFKGNHAELYWARISTDQIPFSIYFGADNMFFQLLKTPNPGGAFNTNTTVSYPEGNIGIMNAIQPIGTKFKKAEALGPQSQKNVELNSPYEGVIWLDFR
ncbi:MAG TPA: glycoside hydrolase family 2 TIM barrel-domain containing protein [Hanamia sp.]|nr:glycoside hydrolase family 2 TIM barrel-domain containing protein [Hanamia sp.]